MLADAERLLNRGDTPAAKDLYGKARAQYRRQGNAAGEAAAVFGLGKLEHVNGQSDPARVAFSEALTLFRQANDAANQARVLVALGDLEKDTFHGVKAAEHYRAARTLWAAASDPKSDAHVLLNLDGTPSMPAGEQRARAVLEQADKIFHNIDDDAGEADTAFLLGMLEWNLGRVMQARPNFHWARDQYAALSLTTKELDALVQIAMADIDLGYNIDARDHIASADGLAAGDAVAAARVALVRGDLERMQGKLDLAREQYVRAATGFAGTPAEAEARLKLGQVQAALGDTAGARAALDAAVARFRAQGAARGEAAASLGLGTLSADKAHMTAAAEKSREAKDPGGEGRAQLALGALALQQNDAAAANGAFTAAGERFAVAKSPFGQVLAALGRGDAARAAANSTAAIAAYREATTLRQSITEPLGEASRALGLAPVDSLVYVAMGEEMGDETPPDPAIVKAAVATRAANAAAYPAFSPEGRTLLAETEMRLAAAAEFVRGGGAR